MPAFPGTTLEEDTLDQPYGGRPENAWGLRSWKWINSVVRFLSQAHLSYNRVGYTTIAVQTTEDATAGQVAVFDLETSNTDGTPHIAPYADSPRITPHVAGVYVTGGAADARTRLITSGIIPRSISGFGAQTTVSEVGIDPATSRMRIAQVGDTVIGKVGLSGDVLFTGYGSAL